MKKIGITGGIGSGKTIVSEVFKILGVPVFNSDSEAKYLVDKDPDVKKKLKAAFGNDIYSDTGLNREKMAGIIFKDKNALEKMNSIVHPAVRKLFNNWCLKHNDLQYVLQEAAILFESGASKQLDKVITVYAPENERINRVMRRNNISRDDVKNRIKNQLSDEEKIKKSDYVIKNFSNYLVIPQVLEIHKQLFDNF